MHESCDLHLHEENVHASIRQFVNFKEKERAIVILVDFSSLAVHIRIGFMIFQVRTECWRTKCMFHQFHWAFVFRRKSKSSSECKDKMWPVPPLSGFRSLLPRSSCKKNNSVSCHMEICVPVYGNHPNAKMCSWMTGLGRYMCKGRGQRSWLFRLVRVILGSTLQWNKVSAWNQVSARSAHRSSLSSGHIQCRRDWPLNWQAGHFGILNLS